MSTAFVIDPSPAGPEGLERAKIRVMVVDHSIAARHLLKLAFQDQPDIEIVAAEATGAAALERLLTVPVDVVTLDIEMPGMDSIETLRKLREFYPDIRVIMFTPSTRRGAIATLEALAIGADDYVTKSSNSAAVDRSAAVFRTELIEKIRQFFIMPEPAPHALGPMPVSAPRTGRYRIVAIGLSTGGPQALMHLLSNLPAHFPLPVMIAQPMPPVFTRVLAERLKSVSQLHVAEAFEGMEIARGHVLIAPGNQHLRMKRSAGGWAAALDQSPPENSCRPSVDVLFRSLTEHFGNSVLSVVLTGMGDDGLRGTQVVKAAGGYSIVQDRASSAVWSMPGAIAQAGLADQVLPLSELAGELIRLAGS